jgi:mxaA protein
MRIALILIFSLLGCSGSIDEPVSYFNVETPRPFGYVNGDEIPQRIVIETRSGIGLQLGSLPAKGQINRWLNLNGSRLNKADSVIKSTCSTVFTRREVSTTLPGLPCSSARGKVAKTSLPDFYAVPAQGVDGAKQNKANTCAPTVRRYWQIPRLVRLGSQPDCCADSGLFMLFVRLFPTCCDARCSSGHCATGRIVQTDMEQALTIVHRALNSLNGQPLFSTG